MIRSWVFLGGCASSKFRVCKKFRVRLAFVYRVQQLISGIPGCGDEYKVPNLHSEIEVLNMCLSLTYFRLPCYFHCSGWESEWSFRWLMTILQLLQSSASYVGRRLSRSRTNQYHHLHLLHKQLKVTRHFISQKARVAH